MGKGGPLAFLNKKPWHPGNIQNQEEIWKREQAFLAEVEKREELKRQIEEEREAEENATQFQREKLGEQRVEWMYQGGFAAQEDAAKKKEEYLLGKAVDKLPDHGPSEPAARVDELASGSMPTAAKQFSGNETWSRLNADPMLTMKRVEMDKVKNAHEKAKIARLQAQIQLKAAAKLAGKDLSSKKHKKDKKHKKEKKDKEKLKSKRKHRDYGNSDSDEGEGRRDRSPEARRNGDRRHGDKMYPPPPPPTNHQAAHGDAWNGDRRERDMAEVGDRRDRDRRDGRDQVDLDRRDSDRAYGERRDREPDNGYRRDRDRDNGDRRHRYGDNVDRRYRDGDSGNRRDRDGDNGDKRDRDRIDRHTEGKGRADRDRGDRDGNNGKAENQHKKEGYGLVNSHVPEYARQGHRDDTELTKKALDARVAAREKEEREEAERAQAARRKYRPGALTAEEKEHRRREMMGNAEDVQQLRMGLLKRAHDEDMADERAEGRDTDEYLRSEERRMLLASSAVTTIGKKGR